MDAEDILTLFIGIGATYIGAIISFYFIQWEIKREKKKK